MEHERDRHGTQGRAPGRQDPGATPQRLVAACLLALRAADDGRFVLTFGTDLGVASAYVTVDTATYTALSPHCRLLKYGLCSRGAPALLATYLAAVANPGPPLLIVRPGDPPAFRLNFDRPSGAAQVAVAGADARVLLAGYVVPVAVEIGVDR